MATVRMVKNDGTGDIAKYVNNQAFMFSPQKIAIPKGLLLSVYDSVENYGRNNLPEVIGVNAKAEVSSHRTDAGDILHNIEICGTDPVEMRNMLSMIRSELTKTTPRMYILGRILSEETSRYWAARLILWAAKFLPSVD